MAVRAQDRAVCVLEIRSASGTDLSRFEKAVYEGSPTEQVVMKEEHAVELKSLVRSAKALGMKQTRSDLLWGNACICR